MHRSKQHLYSITSSARVSTDGGTVRPSALAVLRLILSVKLVVSWTGRSPAPARQPASTLRSEGHHGAKNVWKWHGWLYPPARNIRAGE